MLFYSPNHVHKLNSTRELLGAVNPKRGNSVRVLHFSQYLYRAYPGVPAPVLLEESRRTAIPATKGLVLYTWPSSALLSHLIGPGRRLAPAAAHAQAGQRPAKTWRGEGASASRELSSDNKIRPGTCTEWQRRGSCDRRLSGGAARCGVECRAVIR